MLMTRNLLYTGVTRAKKCVCIVGRKETFSAMIANEDQHRRYSGLQWQLVNYYNEEQCSVSDTSAIVEYDDFCKSLKKAMKNLASTQREVIECVKLNQMSVKETAVKLRLKEQTVKNALSAGLKVLKEILKKSLVLILSFVLK